MIVWNIYDQLLGSIVQTVYLPSLYSHFYLGQFFLECLCSRRSLNITCVHFSLECRNNSLTFGKPNYLNFVREEHLACRRSAALFDLSAFVKLEIEVNFI